MQIVKYKYNFCPYIKTEETILSLLEGEKDIIDDKYTLCHVPLAHLINTVGIHKTNSIIKSLKGNNRIFICQHILVNKLVFNENDIVFTPHSSLNDKFISIPHYSVNYDKSYIKENKEHLFSFLGSTTTHYTRKRIVNIYESCMDSNTHWGLDNKSIDFKEKYIKLLGNSYFSLCPRGTGISSVRLFESMAMESIPVIIADNYYPPIAKLNWNEFSVNIKESDIDKIDFILKEYNADDINYMSQKVKEVYNEYFCNELLHKSILEHLNLN